jgi:hypothetical protein
MTFILIFNLLISWKWEDVGGIIYLILGAIFYFFVPFLPLMMWNDQMLHPFHYCSIPLGLIGALFCFRYYKLEKESLVFIFCPFCGLKMPKPDRFTSCIVCNKDLAFLN